jgi:hypothetical protein
MPSTPGVPGGALPFSGPIDLATINAEWGLGTDLTVYHGVKWYYDGNLTNGVFNSSTLNVSDFYGKRATDPAGSGVYFANASGSGSFTIPLYRNSIKIEIWGGGGAGGNGNGGTGTDGGDSNVLGVTAGGGKAGGAGHADLPGPPLETGTNERGGRDPVDPIDSSTSKSAAAPSNVNDIGDKNGATGATGGPTTGTTGTAYA